MSEAIDKAFEQALVRSMGGEDPIESAKLVHVSGLAFVQQERVKASLFQEVARWEQMQVDMFNAQVPDTSQRWLDAKEVHDILVSSYKSQLKLLQAVGNPRGFTI